MSTLTLRLGHDIREGVSALAFGIAGWAVSAAAMMLTNWIATPTTALAVHTVVCPVIFVFVALVYFQRTEPLHPLAAALMFGTTVIVFDALLRAIFGEASNLRALVVTTVIPAYGAAAVTWLTGAAGETAQ